MSGGVGGALALSAFGALILAGYALAIEPYSLLPDELRYLEQAAAIADGGPLGPGDPYFNSWAQLVPALYALAFLVADDVGSAVDAARVLGALALASAALPVYMLVRDLAGHALGLLAGALTLLVPWVAMTAGLVTEPVAYGVAAWAFLVIVRAIAQPSPARDAGAVTVALLGFGARPQLAVLGPIFLGSIIVEALRAAAVGGSSGFARRFSRSAFAAHPIAWAVVAVVALVFATGALDRDDVLVTAVGAWDGLFPSISIAAAGRVLVYVALALGGLPLVLALAWSTQALVSRPVADRTAPAAAAVVVVGLAMLVLQAGLLPLQLPVRVQDRYLAYAAPLIAVGGCAALAVQPLPTWLVAGYGAGLATLIAQYGFFDNGVTLASPTFATHDGLAMWAGRTGSALGVDELGVGTLLAVYLLLAVGAVVAAGQRLPPAQCALAVGGAILVFCTAVTARTLAAFLEGAPDAPAAGTRAWVDRAADPGADVVAVPGPFAPGDVPAGSFSSYRLTARRWADLAFWNRAVRRPAVLRGSAVYWQEFARPLTVAPSGRVTPSAPLWLVARSDQRFRPAGGVILAGNGGADLIRAPVPTRAAWVIDGADQEGLIGPRRTARLRWFGAETAVELVLWGVDDRPAQVRVSAVDGRRSVQVEASRAARLRVHVSPRRAVELGVGGPARVQLVAVERP